VVGLAAMAKMADGYDSENGNWYYAVLDPSGTQPVMQGKIEKCMDCHDSADERDYVFGPKKE